MLRIGITYNPGLELFYSSLNQTALLLAELFKELGYTVSLVDSKNTDAELFTPKLDGVLTTKMFQTKGLDYLIDIDGFVNPAARKNAAKNSIVFLRTFVQFAEMDNSVYPEKPYIPRSFEGVSEIWCWDILNPKETLESIQTMFHCPIRTVPFIWSPMPVSQYNGESLKYNTEKPWTIHIAEKNTNNSSSSIIPLVAIRELVHNNKDFSASYKCHNMEHILENKFLKENVLNNIEADTLPIMFVAKEPFYSWLSNENVIMLSHSRFTPLRIGLINALWLGIPIIHNSSILKELHPELAKMFYFGNSISEISGCFSTFMKGVNDYIAAKESIQNAIIAKWSIANNLAAWRCISLGSPGVPTAVAPTIAPIVTPTAVTPTGTSVTIAFSDMWPGFNYNNNFIIDSLRHELKTLGLGISIQGINYTSDSNPKLLIFGPYGDLWKLVPNTISKVYFSAENWDKPCDPSIKLFLTSSKTEDNTHMRIPTWITFIDWFSDSKELPVCEDNPIRIPLHFATSPHPTPFKDREEFCAFVVSNPVCTFRNDTFKSINAYKTVNSGGALYNNIGGQLSLKYPGGGCGDISKYNFFSKHKFTISFENSQADGYITEKVLHAKMAGCIPLYWGDKDTDTDFAKGSIVNLSQMTAPEHILAVLKKLEENPDMCSKIAATPILNEEKKVNALSLISKMAKRLIGFLQDSAVEVSSMPCGIDKIFLINLDTRADRLESLMAAEPYLKNITTRIPAVNGKTLKMNQFIYNMFNKNQFQWKKSVIGCNLSHITTWSKILNEPGEYFLVLEDDVRFKKNWLEDWDKCAKNIPQDADILYLGGVLPPNKPALPQCMEQVNDYWCQIIPNTFFSSTPVALFHFCAYSYILTKRGAKKLIDFLTNSDLKSFTISDQLLISPNIGLKKYFTNPLLSYCFQEDDPVYLNSQFNDLHRKDNFDSDIWNNTECFSEDELAPFKTTTIYHLSDTASDLYETQWLNEIIPNYTFKQLTQSPNNIDSNALFLVQRPFIDQWRQIFNNFLINNITFKVLHLSDEFGKDNIDFYTLPNCKGVIRNYFRQDVTSLPHIITIPLGYHHKGRNTKSFSDRKLVWSFHGNSWFNRKAYLENIYAFSPHNCFFIDEWNAPNMTKQDQYLATLANSKFCPILRGNNIETFRLYEVLEVGTIPIYVRQEGDDAYWQLLSSKLGLLELETWKSATMVIETFLNYPDEGEKYRTKIYDAWQRWKSEIKASCLALL
jgi:GR25 family glycosyltransferase involved in LPS biosynthesis